MGEFFMEKANANVEFLNLIYQNAQMGLIGIDAVIDKVENEEVAKLIKEQRVEYDRLCNMAKTLLMEKFHTTEEGISALKKLSSKIMSEMMTINKSDKNIVKLMIEGNEKGVIAIREKLNAYQEQDEDIVDLAQKLLATEEHNMKEFEPYL